MSLKDEIARIKDVLEGKDREYILDEGVYGHDGEYDTIGVTGLGEDADYNNSTPFEILGQGEWSNKQLKNAVKNIAPGCNPADVQVIMDCTIKGFGGIFGGAAFKSGIVVTEDRLWDSYIEENTRRGAGDIHMPIRFADVEAIRQDYDTSKIFIDMKNGQHFVADAGIYGRFDFQVLQLMLRRWNAAHPAAPAPTAQPVVVGGASVPAAAVAVSNAQPAAAAAGGNAPAEFQVQDIFVLPGKTVLLGKAIGQEIAVGDLVSNWRLAPTPILEMEQGPTKVKSVQPGVLVALAVTSDETGAVPVNPGEIITVTKG